MTDPAIDCAVEIRARRIYVLIVTAGVVGPLLGAIVGRILSRNDFWNGPILPWNIGSALFGGVELLFAALPYLVLASLARRRVRQHGDLTGAWFGALITGLLASAAICTELFFDIDTLFFSTMSGLGELVVVTVSSLAMVLGGGIGWLIQRLAHCTARPLHPYQR